MQAFARKRYFDNSADVMLVLFHVFVYAINEFYTPRCIKEIREIVFEVTEALKEFSESANETGTPQERELKSKYFELRGVKHMFTFQKKRMHRKRRCKHY